MFATIVGVHFCLFRRLEIVQNLAFALGELKLALAAPLLPSYCAKCLLVAPPLVLSECAHKEPFAGVYLVRKGRKRLFSFRTSHCC